MEIGDIVVRKSYSKDVVFKIIDMDDTGEGIICRLKGINLRIIADSPINDLEPVQDINSNETEIILNRKVSSSIKKIISGRAANIGGFRRDKEIQLKEMTFGRPGKILHIDGDPDYLEVCLKVYKQLSLDAIGKVIIEKEQPVQAVKLVKEIRPDIVVITGHDAMAKDIKDYTDLKYYKNSRYFVETVTELRNFEPNYDDLVIFAGACQSCYEKILDSGANFSSSPSRVLIHCLDPVFVCEKIAYTSVEKVVSIQDAIENTITGTKGIGGLQTRGKYREGYPKSPYA